MNGHSQQTAIYVRRGDQRIPSDCRALRQYAQNGWWRLRVPVHSLLLFCIIDAVSNYVGRPKNTLLEIQSIFPELTEKQISDLKKWYRNLLTHQAIIMPGTQLSDDREGTPIEFGLGREPTHIRVIPFCRVVKRWWETFDKSLIDPKFDPKQAPKKPVPKTTSLPGILGSHVTTKY
jgi:hypothetical protein